MPDCPDYPNYEEMYLTMVRATEKAMNILIAAQEKCEDMYLCVDDQNVDRIKDLLDELMESGEVPRP